MKPRLPSVPLTYDDEWIWADSKGRPYLHRTAWVIGESQDRRDANLMWNAQLLRVQCYNVRAQYGSIEIEGVLMTGRRLGVRYLDTDSVCIVS